MVRSKGLILIVDDEPLNLQVLAGLLEDEYDVLAATDGEQALELARSALPDLVLLDVMMPGMDGYEVCARLRASPATAGLPIIFITGLDDDQAETRGLELGAVDYVAKPVVPQILCRRVRNHVDLKRSHDRLARLATTDGLTGIANRRRFDQGLELECRRLGRTSAGRLALIMIDIDHFKAFNDTYGHMAGDACLKAVAGVIATHAHRANDVVARYGGEEFACILPETDHEGALAVAERIRLGICELAIPHAASATAAWVTASLGVVSATSGVAIAPSELLVATDIQLYRAKSAGRNRIKAAVAAVRQPAAAAAVP